MTFLLPMLLDPTLRTLTEAACHRLHADLTRAAPHLAERVAAWGLRLAQSAEAADYFTRPQGFPLLYLPWWLEQTLAPQPDLAFQRDLIYSDINGYYFIRLMDNVMDGHGTAELKLMPAMAFFHAQFHAAYFRHLSATHPFWDYFNAQWFHSAEVTALDAHLDEVDWPAFEHLAGQKVCAGKIPLAAVCYRHNQQARLPAWELFFDRLGQWHQFFNDLFDWNKDLAFGTRTYFLGEAAKRKHPRETVAEWVVRTGFEWGLQTLYTWLREIRGLAAPLGSAPLLAYLDLREHLLREQSAGLRDDLARLTRLAQAWPKA
jgi:hypothetical protein